MSDVFHVGGNETQHIKAMRDTISTLQAKLRLKDKQIAELASQLEGATIRLRAKCSEVEKTQMQVEPFKKRVKVLEMKLRQYEMDKNLASLQG